MERMFAEHALRCLDLELQWHQELLQRLPELLASLSLKDIRSPHPRLALGA
jgi:hypothetical protein